MAGVRIAHSVVARITIRCQKNTVNLHAVLLSASSCEINAISLAADRKRQRLMFVQLCCTKFNYYNASSDYKQIPFQYLFQFNVTELPHDEVQLITVFSRPIRQSSEHTARRQSQIRADYRAAQISPDHFQSCNDELRRVLVWMIIPFPSPSQDILTTT